MKSNKRTKDPASLQHLPGVVPPFGRNSQQMSFWDYDVTPDEGKKAYMDPYPTIGRRSTSDEMRGMAGTAPIESPTLQVTVPVSLQENRREPNTIDNDSLKNLCLSLMRADSEEEVISLLTGAGYWNDSSAWRFYGDNENNWSTIGNQQSRPESALVEKLVNSIDARLMNECYVHRIDPEGPEAPQNIRQAVARFFDEGRDPNKMLTGEIREWDDDKRTKVAKGITVAATGAIPSSRGQRPCFSIADCGEGQTPDRMPSTLLSLPDRSNKARVPFVQGKFNMGSTGVLMFCGRHNLQLIVTRRNPSILSENARPSDYQWSFTVVRRDEVKGRRPPIAYTYLAPLDAEQSPNRGGVLRFSSETMPIFPEGIDPYSRASEWGTLIKLYEYNARGFMSDMLRKDGLLSRMDLLLPEVALPIRFFECRPYGGGPGSHSTNLTGLSVRLDDDHKKKEEDRNIELSSSGQIMVAGEEMPVAIYAFKKNKADTYKKNEGIILTVNGQMHGRFTSDFFRRNAVGLGYIADSLLMMVDCSKIGELAVAQLFMNSRDRLREGEMLTEIERALEVLLKNEKSLGALRERRQREATSLKLSDSRPLKEIVESLLRRAPALSEFFLQGTHIATPFKTVSARSDEKMFEGKQYPTFFQFKGKSYGTILRKECAINSPCRVIFETNAMDNYFKRTVDPGEFALFRVVDGIRYGFRNFTLSLHEGTATLNILLPNNCLPGDNFEFIAEVSDSTQVSPFANSFSVTVREAVSESGGNGTKPKTHTQGNGRTREVASGIDIPEPHEVKRSHWDAMEPAFNEFTALRVINAGASVSDGHSGNSNHLNFDYYVNMDNIHLLRELKVSKENADVVRTQFKVGLVLMGMSLLQNELASKKGKKEGLGEEGIDPAMSTIEGKVEFFSKVVAPCLVPMIQLLGSLEEDDLPSGDTSGDAT